MQQAKQAVSGYADKRDRRIDVARGLALLCIFIDHIPGNPLARLTLQRYGFSDASEVFVFLAGVSAALAYGPSAMADGVGAVLGRILRRSRTIYVTHLSLVAALTAGGLVLWFCGATSASGVLSPFDSFRNSTFGTAIGIAFLLVQPEYLDILPLYVVLFVTALPLFLHIARTSLARAMGLSLLVWIVAGALGLNLPSQRSGGWYFNPLAWQFCFSAGLGLGLMRLRRRRPAQSAWLRRGAIAFLAIAFVAAAPWTMLPFSAIKSWRFVEAATIGGISKTDLSAWRFAHLLCLAYVAGTYVPRDASWLRSPLLAWIGDLGRKSLPAFSMTVLLSHAATAVAVEFDHQLWIVLAVDAVGLFSLFLFARYWRPIQWGSIRNALLECIGIDLTREPSRIWLRRRLAAVGMVLVVLLAPMRVAAADVEIQIVQSGAAARSFSVAVYVPVPASPGQKLPVVYVLHGADSSSMTIFEQGDFKKTVDRLLAQNAIPPAVYVVPDAENCWWIDAPGCKAETFFLEELKQFIQRRYPVSQQREHTLLVGISAGGFGALRLAMRYPDQFGAAALLSPAIYFDKPPTFSGARQKSPFVKADGTFDEVLWQSNNYGALLAAYQARDVRTDFYVMSGDLDPYGIPFEVALLHKKLAVIPGQKVRLRIGSGAHDWSYWKGAMAEALTAIFDERCACMGREALRERHTQLSGVRLVEKFGRW